MKDRISDWCSGLCVVATLPRDKDWSRIGPEGVTGRWPGIRVESRHFRSLVSVESCSTGCRTATKVAGQESGVGQVVDGDEVVRVCALQVSDEMVTPLEYSGQISGWAVVLLWDLS
jgi:hypothetical protein